MSSVSTFFTSKLSASKIAAVQDVASRLGFNPNWLLAVMYFETGRTFNPAITNNIGSVGLIQFTRDKKGVEYKTINGVRYYLSDLKEMTFEQQIEVVYEYFKPFKGKVNSFIDTYLVTFFPAALGKSDSFVFQTSGLSASLIAKQNPAFDSNKDGQITKGEVLSYFKVLYNKMGVDFEKDINQSVKTGAGVIISIILLFFYTGYSLSLIF